MKKLLNGTKNRIIILAVSVVVSVGIFFCVGFFGAKTDVVQSNIIYTDTFILGVAAITAFYFLSNFILRRNDKSSLYITLICVLLVVARIVADGLIYRVIPSIGDNFVAVLYYLPLIWFSVLAAFIFNELYPEIIYPKILKGFFVYACLMSAVSLISLVSFYTYLYIPILAVAFIMTMYCAYVTVVAFLKGKSDAYILFLGILMMTGCAVCDFFFALNTSQWGAVILLFVQTFVLVKRFARSMDELKLSLEQAQANETAFLQAQLKPHFLFNTLNAISSFCDTDPALAQKLIDNLSIFIRQSFDYKNPESFVDLDKELSLVTAYLEIEKARFGDELKIEYDIDGEIKGKIPMMSIQPLVENAVVHGIRRNGGNGTVTVSIKKIDSGITVSVKDNGKGIPESKLSTLLEAENTHGIGLWNLDKRLKKFYGSGLNIRSVEGQGTTVTFRIPTGAEVHNCKL